eukprot:Blabericola_migrator_1__1070@NODE_1272_length_4924_cov_54_165946_g548_i1_p1_GENE_NODE_1272_length_4924_cov_54_165946_g548_i1NODE_1272_length_4924_cov_54_165946_g548_i1_p1_ORF_typecomplete_len1137_score239_78_NODE_1272_length_4924_cov_54_165946_g548_i14433853
MPSHNLSVCPSATVESKAIVMGLLTTLTAQGLSLADNASAADFCNQTTTGKKSTRGKPFYIGDQATLDKILENEPGTVYVMRKTSKMKASNVRDMAIRSDPTIAEGIKLLEAQGISYVIEVRRRQDLIKGRGDGAMDLWDTDGLKKGSASYRQAVKNRASLNDIEAADADLAAAVKQILTTVGNLVRVSPEVSAKNKAVQFKYFLEEVSEVLSSLKKTNAPKPLLACAVTAVFAKYKTKCWDGVMKLAGDEAARELQACADVLLDARHVNEYLKLVEEAGLAPPGPSREEFDVAFGVLSEVDKETTSIFRDLLVSLHDTVKPQVESDKIPVFEGLTDKDVAAHKVQLNICIRNYMQCLYDIAQDFVKIRRMSVPDEKAQLQAAMHDRIAAVNRKFWPALESGLEKLCDPSVVEDIRSKEQALTKQLTEDLQRTAQLALDAQSATVKDPPPQTYLGRLTSIMKSLLGKGDEVHEGDIADAQQDQELMSPMFYDLLEIIEQLGNYGQIASSSPEASPNVPETIDPDDHVAICGALGFVSKPRAAALFTYLRRLRQCLQFVDYKGIAKEGELPLIEEFLKVDSHILKVIQDKGHRLGVHGDIDVEDCNKIMTSTFNKYFKKCWSHISAVLEGGDQEEAIKKFEGMATDILEWNDTGKELDLKESQVIQTIKKLAGINAAWYLLGMLQFVQGAREKKWKWTRVDQDMWDNGLCLALEPGLNRFKWISKSGGVPMACLPSDENRRDRLDLAVAQLLWGKDVQKSCSKGMSSKSLSNGTVLLEYEDNGIPAWTSPHSSQYLTTFKERGINPSCDGKFKYQWYDASDSIIKSLCTKALDQSVSEFVNATVPKSDNQLLSGNYEFHLVTGMPQPRFKTEGERLYQGFVMCFDTMYPSDEDIRSKIVTGMSPMSRESRKKKREEQKMCRYRTYRMAHRNTRVFFSTLKVDQDGKLFISNRHHEGYIGTCWPGLLQKLRDVNDKKVRETRDVSNATQNKQPMSAEDIVRTLAEKEGQIKVNETYGNFVDQWNATAFPNWDTSDPTAIGGDYDEPWNVTAPSNETAVDKLSFELNPLDAINGCPDKICGPVRTVWSYWPYVAGVAGTILTLYTAKKVYDCCRPQVIIHKHYMVYKRHKDEDDSPQDP